MKQIGLRLVNNMRFANNVDRSYSDEFKQAGAKVGYTVNCRLPQRYIVNKGQALNPQPVKDAVVPISLTDQANIGLEFSMASLTMEVDNYRERYLEPAVDSLINQCDYDGLQRCTKKTPMVVGTPGTIPGATGTPSPYNSNIIYQLAGVKLTKIGVPQEGRKAMLEANMHAYLTANNFTLFNPANFVGKIFRSGQFSGEALGVSEWYQTQNTYTHTVGPLGGAPAIDGVPANGSAAILTKSWTSAAAKRLSEGDVVQFDGCYEINPMTYASTGALKDFVATADVYSTSGGAATIPISPPIVTSGADQNCSNAPADSAVVTIFGHASSHANKVSPQGLIYVMGAYALVFADLEKPGGLWISERISNKALGIAVRFLKDYSIMTDQSPARVDIMYGWATPRQELGVRICS
jgi:hypothetical protein